MEILLCTVMYRIIFEVKFMDEKIVKDIEKFLNTYYLNPEKSKRHYSIRFSASIPPDEKRENIKRVKLDSPESKILNDSEVWDEEPKEKYTPDGVIPKIRYAIDKIFTNKEDTFSERLFRHIEAKGLTDTEVYKKAGLDRRLFSKIRSNKDYQPSKDTVILLILALELSYDDAIDLIHRAGFTLSMSRKGDVVITYFLYNEIYDISLINEILDQYGFPILGERVKK